MAPTILTILAIIATIPPLAQLFSQQNVPSLPRWSILVARSEPVIGMYGNLSSDSAINRAKLPYIPDLHRYHNALGILRHHVRLQTQRTPSVSVADSLTDTSPMYGNCTCNRKNFLRSMPLCVYPSLALQHEPLE
jgi:hypothetical protein